MGFTQLAQNLTVEPADGPVYFSPRGHDQPTIQYLLLSAATPPQIHGFNGLICVRTPGSGAARYFFLNAEDPRGLAMLQRYLPDSTTTVAARDPWGRPWATELEQPADGRVQFPEMIAHAAQMGDGIELLGYWLSQSSLQPGTRLYVRLFWRSRGQIQKDYTTFVQLLQSEAVGDRRCRSDRPVAPTGRRGQPAGRRRVSHLRLAAGRGDCGRIAA